MPTGGTTGSTFTTDHEQAALIKANIRKGRKLGIETTLFYTYPDFEDVKPSREGWFGFGYSDGTTFHGEINGFKPVWNVARDAVLNGTQ